MMATGLRNAPSPATPTNKYAHLNLNDSLEKARKQVANNEIEKYEERKHQLEAKAAKRRRDQAEKDLNARKREEEAKRTGEELGSRLLSSLRDEVLARMETQYRDEALAAAKKERETWYDEFVETEKSDIRIQLTEELKPVVLARLTIAHMDEVKESLKSDLTPEICTALWNDYSEQVEDEVREGLKTQLTPMVIETLRRDHMQVVIEELREENKEAVIDELRRELAPKVEDDLRTKHTLQDPEALCNGQQGTDSHEKVGRLGEQQQLPASFAGPDARTESLSYDSLPTDELYPSLEKEPSQKVEDNQDHSNSIDGKSGLQTTSTHTRTDTPIAVANGHPKADSHTQKATEEQESDTLSGAYETAREGKDHRWKPEYPIQFSSPSESKSVRKRSLSPSSHMIEESTHRLKRARSLTGSPGFSIKIDQDETRKKGAHVDGNDAEGYLNIAKRKKTPESENSEETGEADKLDEALNGSQGTESTSDKHDGGLSDELEDRSVVSEDDGNTGFAQNDENRGAFSDRIEGRGEYSEDGGNRRQTWEEDQDMNDDSGSDIHGEGFDSAVDHGSFEESESDVEDARYQAQQQHLLQNGIFDEDEVSELESELETYTEEEFESDGSFEGQNEESVVKFTNTQETAIVLDDSDDAEA